MIATRNNFTIKDNSSDFATFLPNKWIEPLTIIAKIKGYDGIDDYIMALIKGRLQMFVDTTDTIEYEEFQKYIHNKIIGEDVPNEWTSNNKEEEEASDENASKFVKQVNEEYHHDMKHTADDKEKEDLK